MCLVIDMLFPKFILSLYTIGKLRSEQQRMTVVQWYSMETLPETEVILKNVNMPTKTECNFTLNLKLRIDMLG